MGSDDVCFEISQFSSLASATYSATPRSAEIHQFGSPLGTVYVRMNFV